jgi:hypothetical protein
MFRTGRRGSGAPTREHDGRGDLELGLTLWQQEVSVKDQSVWEFRLAGRRCLVRVIRAEQAVVRSPFVYSWIPRRALVSMGNAVVP